MPMEASSQEQLKQIVERIEKLMGDMSDIKRDIKEIYIEAKSDGFDVKALKDIIRMRKKDRDELAEQDEIIQLYRSALDM